MSERILLQLQAIAEAITKIERYSAPFENADIFYHDEKSFDATMMQFVVIGEMIQKLDERFKQVQEHIPWQKIKDFRNIIAHDYFGIDAEEIWDIILHHIPLFKIEIEQLITSNT